MFYSRLRNLFRRKPVNNQETVEVSNVEILDELRELKKALRRQGIGLDLLKKELFEKIDGTHLKEIDPFLDFTDALFYFERSVRGTLPVSSAQEETLTILWEKLDGLLLSTGVEVIREAGVEFDSRRHEAVETLPDHEGRPFVKEILQPGYLHEGNVIRPAKALLERKEFESWE